MSEAEVTVERAAARGMIQLRADLADDRVRAAVDAAAGGGVPETLRWWEDAERGVLWFGPDELLILTPRAEARATRDALAAALSGLHHLAEDVSDARAVYRIAGPDARVRETLARLTPIDLHPAAAPAGTCRRTRLAQVPAAILIGQGAARVLVFRSVADYAEGCLTGAAASGPLHLY